MRLGRLRRGPKAPLAVAGILATPLFFVALMAFSLKLDEPTVGMTKKGAEVLGDPTRASVGLIYLLALGVSGFIVVVGLVSLTAPVRTAVFLPSLAAIAVAVALLLPLDTWETEHTARYPVGVDLIPRNDPSDLILRGEWEENARRTAHQLGIWTMAIAVAAMAIAVLVEVRRRRGIVGPPVPPPPDVVTGESGMVRRGLGRPWGRPGNTP